MRSPPCPRTPQRKSILWSLPATARKPVSASSRSPGGHPGRGHLWFPPKWPGPGRLSEDSGSQCPRCSLLRRMPPTLRLHHLQPFLPWRVSPAGKEAQGFSFRLRGRPIVLFSKQSDQCERQMEGRFAARLNSLQGILMERVFCDWLAESNSFFRVILGREAVHAGGQQQPPHCSRFA